MNINFRKVFYLLLSILIVFFIFYNSLQNGNESSNLSNTVLNYLNTFLENIGLKFKLEGYFIRKTAHFVEFFALGFSIMFTFEAFTQKTIQVVGFPLFLCTIIPVLDEYIQLFSEGRFSQVKDVLLDFSGAVCGIIFVIIWVFFKNKFFKKNKYNSYKINYRI